MTVYWLAFLRNGIPTASCLFGRLADARRLAVHMGGGPKIMRGDFPDGVWDETKGEVVE